MRRMILVLLAIWGPPQGQVKTAGLLFQGKKIVCDCLKWGAQRIFRKTFFFFLFHFDASPKILKRHKKHKKKKKIYCQFLGFVLRGEFYFANNSLRNIPENFFAKGAIF